MAARQDIISAIELELTTGKPSDDFEIDERQIAFHLDRVRDDFVTEKLSNQYRVLNYVDPAYIRTDYLPLDLEDAPVNLGEYLATSTLLHEPLALIHDMGVVRIVSDAGTEIRKITESSDAWMVRHLKFAKPTQDNIVYYRRGMKLVFDGLQENYDEIDHVVVHYVPSMSGWSDEQKELDYPLYGELKNMVIEECVRILRNELTGGLYDIENDGVQNG